MADELLLVVGGGRMGEALAAGLLDHGWPADRLAVVEPIPARRADLAAGRLSPVTIAATIGDATPGSGGFAAVVAVKPYDVEGVCRDLARAGATRVLSIAAGVRLADLESWLGAGGPVALRAMPNTPALVGAGASALAAGTRSAPPDLEWALGVLGSVGTVVEVAESALDAVTGLSGSGPAYVFLVAEALIDAGVLVGLPRATAKDLAVQTLLGAARLLSETGDEPSALRAAVTSPGGTTAAGLRALESAGVRAAVLDAVAAATQRSRELAG